MATENVLQQSSTNEGAKQPSQLDRAPIDSKELIGSRDFLEILHEGAIYRLRITKLKKLILTK
jgi:hemin uptake protein HemP